MAFELTITPTPITTTVNGVPCRLWEGKTPDGGRVQVYVAAAAAQQGSAADAALGRELEGMPAPEESWVPLWMVAPGRPRRGEN